MSLAKIIVSTAMALPILLSANAGRVCGEDAKQSAQSGRAVRELWVVVGLEPDDGPTSIIKLANGSPAQVYFQSADRSAVMAVREAASAAGLLGTRIIAEHGDVAAIHMGSNLADRILVADGAAEKVRREEILRVLHPGATATVGGEQIVKTRDAAVDTWSHVYHGPDNNPQSSDQLARAPYRTQFLATPLFCPMPEVTVAAGGRIFKAFGHIAHKANQNPVLNTLYCINAFNGSVLWTRPLSEGFMIHRSTMIATEEVFYLADDKSCKVINPLDGTVEREIVVPDKSADGKVWKWMALQDGVLYALVGDEEIQVDTVTSNVRGMGHWPWGMWKGHDYNDPRTNFGFGRTFLAIDPATGAVLWRFSNPDYIDSRGLCMRGNRIYFLCPENYLACLDITSQKLAWKNSDSALLDAIGPNERAQHYVTGYATTSYMKCNDDQLFFAGPQRTQFVVASATDGRLLWTKPQGNLQLVLRDNGVYCAGPQLGARNAGAIYSYAGERLASLPIRRACTRATGSVDGVFYRTAGGTVRVDTANNSAEHIAPMRPPCQDGVVISDGLLFWGPWMCGCQLSLYGHISLGPATGAASVEGTPEPQHQTYVDNVEQVTALPFAVGDWPAYMHDNWRSAFSRVDVPQQVELAWQTKVVDGHLPTAPIVAGDMVFIADRSGAVQAYDSQGQRQWRFLAGGPIYYPPRLDNDRLFFGSGDGHVYALEAISGRLLWTYRVAPTARRIPVYGSLISTWPVAGGVAAVDGVVYAAAGIAHYDGTHVVALDEVTGEVVWTNDSSGSMAEDVNCGISLQGALQIRGNELQFLGGGAYLFARYDRQTGKCLNEPRHQVTSAFQTAFYPYYPNYAQYMALNHTFSNGRTLRYNPSIDGSRPTRLAVLKPVSDTPQRPAAKGKTRAKVRSDRAQRPPQRAPVWSTHGPELLNAFVVTEDVLLSGGRASNGTDQAELIARSLDDGTVTWRRDLPASPVKAGIAIDSKQRVVVALKDGQLMCFEAQQ